MAGISPELLVSQVRNTAPYVFDDLWGDVAASPPGQIVRAFEPSKPLSHAAYFRLCLSAHYLTCATPVPTDVDNQIRRKLWTGAREGRGTDALPLATALEMASFVLDTHDWDFGPLTARQSYGAIGSACERTPISGHLGEWFTVASAAYAALGLHRAPEAKELRERLLEAVAAEVERHSDVFASLWRAKDGVGALLASVSIAHNFGDLDRVIDMWDVPVADPLRLRFAKLTTSAFDSERRLRHQGRLWTAGELYKARIDGSSMAGENHRHFALRKPRALRSRPELRIPIGPFFDGWGAAVAGLDEQNLGEVVDALAHGCERMASGVGYPRALHAIFAQRPETTSRVEALRTNAVLRKKIEMPREEMEARWNAAALAHLDEIPSRA